MKNRLKQWLFKLLGKDPEAVVVSFLSGDERLARAMTEEVERLEPARRHFEISKPGERIDRKYRIGLAPVLFDGDQRYRVLRSYAFRLAPTRILAYNTRLERHHLRLTSPIASWLFWRGVPLDRIFLRPRWLWPFRRDKTIRYKGRRIVEGRPRDKRRRSIAILTPYFPYPLSHGGAVRIFNLIRETAREFDIVLYAFTEHELSSEDLRPVLEFVSRVYLVKKPRYREPRWSTIAPPEVAEYFSPTMDKLIRARTTDLLQVEYTYLASYGGDALVEHDVTYDLYAQVRARHNTTTAWWDWWRWHRYESSAVRRFRRVVVMSEKDRTMLDVPAARIIENGVDIARFRPSPETPGRRLLFIGSFRHFPNIVAFRFLTEEILPLLHDVHLTVVAGPDAWLHWTERTGGLPPPERANVRILEFVADVRPLYVDANVVAVPTLESAGTNVKVLEALAMQRAVVSTSSGCAGLGLQHVRIADSAADFAAAIETLLSDETARSECALRGREHVERHFDWRAIGIRQRDLYHELLSNPVTIRKAEPADAPSIYPWDPAIHDCSVAVAQNRVIGFIVTRETAPAEHELLYIAVDPAERRRGIARRLLDRELAASPGAWFLEVRESNLAAMRLYESLGFTPAGYRENYYDDPPETAIVMRFFS